MGWREYAACVGYNPELWFPLRRGDPAARAKAICATCPVRDDCLDEAVESQEPHGVWGGLSEHGRRRLVRQRHGHGPLPRWRKADQT